MSTTAQIIIDSTATLGSHQRTFKDFFLNKASTLTPSYRKSSVTPPGGLFVSNTFQGGHIWEGGGGLFNLAKMMVSVLLKELEYKVEKF